MGESVLRICFRRDTPVDKTVPVRFVLDFDATGQTIGVEILNLKYHVGQACLDRFLMDTAAYPEPISFSYDDEVDAFSLRIRDGRSVDQLAVTGRVQLDAAGCIVGFEADRDSP
jgi:uncharacterized protein YuzE